MDDNFKSQLNNKHSFSNSSLDETSWIKKICEKESSADKALPLIISEIEAEPFYYKRVEQIQFQINSIANRFFKGLVFSVTPFGSAVTKLALKNSDVDIFVDFGEQLPSPPEIFVKSLRNKIGKSKTFYQPKAIPARVPVVQCKHQSGISCDVSFLNGLGIWNSNLIKFMVELDQRIRPLILIIKYLLKKKGLISNYITSYSVVVLVIYFLQQLEEPLLPSINHLQSLSTEKRQVAGWETSFTTNSSLLPPITNKSSIPELLKQFFEFYSTFEFGLYVISSFTAKTYLKPFFNNPDLLPDEYKCYKENVKNNSNLRFECNKCMCVQGPFNHSHNITRSVTLKSLQLFQSFCSESKQISLDNLTSIYFENLFLNGIGGIPSKKLKSDEDIKNVLIPIGTNIDFSNPNCTVEDLINHWSDSTVSRIKSVFDKVMKCTIEEGNISSEIRSITTGEILKMYDCVFHYFELVTKKRNKAKQEFKFPENMDLINQEEVISNYLCETLSENLPKMSLKFSVTCILDKDPTCVCVSLQCKENSLATKHLLQQVFQFIKTSLPKYFK